MDPDQHPYRALTRSGNTIATGIRSDDRPAWLRARRRGIGGSDAAAILGLSPYKSALSVYADKVTEQPPDERETEIMAWGHIFEAPILTEYGRRTERDVVGCGELLADAERPWRIVTPDGAQLGAPSWAEGPGVAEVKTTGYGADFAAEIPAAYQVQVQHALMVTGAEWATLVWLPFPERRLQWLDIAPHAEFQSMLAEKVDDFWRRVVERRPPDADGSESSFRALRALHPELTEETCELTGAEQAADEYEKIAGEIRWLEIRKGLIRNRVLQSLGSTKTGLLRDGRYWNSWIVDDRTESCPHCRAALREVHGFRAARLMPPRKKPHAMPSSVRALTLEPDPEIVRLLEASLEKP